MDRLAKLITPIAGVTTFERICLAASLLFLIIVAANVHSTVSGMSVQVTIGSVETPNR